MKDEDYMLARARQIVDEEVEARVIVCYPDIVAAKDAAWKFAKESSNGTWMSQAMTYIANTGSLVLFRVVTEENKFDHAGIAVTHAFDMGIYYKAADYIKTRIRSPSYKGKYPMGLYNKNSSSVTN